MVAGYASLGASVTVLTTGRQSAGVTYGEFGEEIHRTQPRPRVGGAVRRIQAVAQSEVSTVANFTQRQRSEPFDLLEIPDWLTPFFAPFRARRVFMKIHGPADYIRMVNGEERPTFSQRILDSRARFWAMRANVVHSGAQVLSDFAADVWKLKREVPVTVDPWAPETDLTDQRGSVSFDDGLVELVMVGRLEWRKGQHVTLEALQRMPPRSFDRPWRLTLIGRDTATAPDKGSYRAYCESIASDRVRERIRWIDGVPRSELPLIHNAADVTIVHTIDGHYGYTSIQALCDGACLVTNLEPGNPNSPYIQNGTNGVLVPFGDASALSKALVELLANPQLRNSIRASAREIRKVVQPSAVAHRVLKDVGLTT